MFGPPDAMTIAETKALQGRRRRIAITIATCGASCMVLRMAAQRREISGFNVTSRNQQLFDHNKI
jgi:hypothetical protein